MPDQRTDQGLQSGYRVRPGQLQRQLILRRCCRCMQHRSLELPSGSLELAVNNRHAMALRSVAVITVTAGTEIVRRILSAAQIGREDLLPAAQNELAQVIMVMRLVVVAALGREAEGTRSRDMPRYEPSGIRKIAAACLPGLLFLPGPCPDQIAQRRCEAAAVILRERGAQRRRRAQDIRIDVRQIMGESHMHPYAGTESEKLAT